MGLGSDRGHCLGHRGPHSALRTGQLESRGRGLQQPTPTGHETTHLLVFQQDQAHDGDVDGVPDAGIVKKAGHLPREVFLSPRIQGGYGSHCHPQPSFRVTGR